MKRIICLGLVLWGFNAVADSACVEAFRSTYLEFSRTNSPALQDVADVYAVYFDYSLGLTPIQNPDQKRMLDFIKDGIEGGSLCKGGSPLSKIQIYDLLIEHMNKNSSR